MSIRALQETSKRVMEQAANRYQRARVSGIIQQTERRESVAEIREAVRRMMMSGEVSA